MSALALQSFGFEGQTVRVMQRDDLPWFVAQDVCGCLEIANHRDAVAKLDDDERDCVGITDAIHRERETLVISESGLYALIFKSRKPAAVRFRKWVTGEVLPTLRRTGRYLLANDDQAEQPLIDDIGHQDLALKLAHIREIRMTYGRETARRAWEEVGLPPVGTRKYRPGTIGHRMVEARQSVLDWMAACVSADAGAMTMSSELYASYASWCQARNIVVESQTHFGLSLGGMGYDRLAAGNGRIYRVGLRLSN